MTEKRSFETDLNIAEHELTLPEHASAENAQEQAKQIEKAEKAHSESLVEAREQVADLAKAEHQTLAKEALETAEDDSSHYASNVNKELKGITLQRELKQIRDNLSKPERALSKTIHQPFVRAVSEGAGKTISRPSGLLGGGILAFIGTTVYLYMAKHIGFEYNYFIFLALFAGGFAVGLILELAVHLSTSKKH